MCIVILRTCVLSFSARPLVNTHTHPSRFACPFVSDRLRLIIQGPINRMYRAPPDEFLGGLLVTRSGWSPFLRGIELATPQMVAVRLSM